MRKNLFLISMVLLLGLFTASTGFACDSLTVNADAAMASSSFGLDLAFGADLSSCFVQDDTPNGETVYSAFFRMNKGPGFSMDVGDGHAVFRATGGGTTVLEAKLRRFGNDTYVQLQAKKDDGTFSRAIASIAPGQAGWKFEWRASSAPGANDGLVRILKRLGNGTFSCIKEVTGIDNDTRAISSQRIGAMGGIDTNTTGATYYDTFESFRTIEASPTCNQTFVD